MPQFYYRMEGNVVVRRRRIVVYSFLQFYYRMEGFRTVSGVFKLFARGNSTIEWKDRYVILQSRSTSQASCNSTIEWKVELLFSLSLVVLSVQFYYRMEGVHS